MIELDWLAQEWMSAYRLGDGDLHAAAEWHTRYLPAAIDGIRRTSDGVRVLLQAPDADS